MTPPSGHNFICKNPQLPDQHNQSEPRGVSDKCQSISCICSWQPHCPTQRVLGSAPPPHRRSACSYLVRYIQAQTVNNGREQTENRAEKCPTIAHVKREDWRRKAVQKERIWPSQRENTNEYRSLILEVEGAACQAYVTKDWRATQS